MFAPRSVIAMPHVVVDLPGQSRKKQDADPTLLSREVWKHEGIATSQGLQPVIELYSHKSKVCKRLTKLWKRDTEVRSDTLNGIYLIRVNLLKHGPKAVLALTQRVVLGVPLFVAWNPLGQVLSPREFGGFSDSELEVPLSAFFEDVVAGKPFRLSPAASRKRRQSAIPRQHSELIAPEPKQEAKDEPALPINPNPNVAALSQQLDAYLDKARALATDYLAERGLLFDATLESLVDLDVHIRETTDALGASQQEQQQLQRVAGALAVYFGETIRSCVDATWHVDLSKTSVVDALRLTIAEGDGQNDIAPAQLLLEAVSSRAPTLFGQAVKLSGLLENAGPELDWAGTGD